VDVLSGSQEAAQSAKKYYNPTVKVINFSVGDRVLVYTPKVSRTQYPKWKRTFSSVAVITQKVNDITFRFEGSRKTKVVHADKMKLLQASGGADHPGSASLNPKTSPLLCK
jgi:hypothetical protein